MKDFIEKIIMFFDVHLFIAVMCFILLAFGVSASIISDAQHKVTINERVAVLEEHIAALEERIVALEEQLNPISEDKR